MLSHRPLIVSAAGGGLLLASLAWFATRLLPGATALDTLETQLVSGAPRSAAALAPRAGAAGGGVGPLFSLNAGPGATQEPAIELKGIARYGRRASTLIAIDGGPPVWLDQGDSAGPVTLLEVGAAKAVFDTPTALRLVVLGEPSTAQAALSPSEVQDQPPAGYKLPPEPASAVGAP